MNRQPTRRAPWRRVLIALGGVALLAVLVVAALLLRGAFTERDGSRSSDTTASASSATGGREHVGPSLHAFHQPPFTRARGVALALLAAATVVAACGSRRIRVARRGRGRSLRIVGLPPGRAPPRLHLV